jgi:hypothetical protein
VDGIIGDLEKLLDYAAVVSNLVTDGLTTLIVHLGINQNFRLDKYPGLINSSLKILFEFSLAD